MPRVINIRKKELNKVGYESLENWLESSEDHVYIGRNMSYYVKGANTSKWANPFSVKKYGIDKSLELYKEHLVKSKLVDHIDELRGKTLGCWCSPGPCHGDILAEISK
jgi:hypothetical protein